MIYSQNPNDLSRDMLDCPCEPIVEGELDQQVKSVQGQGRSSQVGPALLPFYPSEQNTPLRQDVRGEQHDLHKNEKPVQEAGEIYADDFTLPRPKQVMPATPSRSVASTADYLNGVGVSREDRIQRMSRTGSMERMERLQKERQERSERGERSERSERNEISERGARASKSAVNAENIVFKEKKNKKSAPALKISLADIWTYWRADKYIWGQRIVFLGWCLCFLLFVRIIFSKGGVIDYQTMAQFLERKRNLLLQIQNENKSTAAEITLIKTDPKHQKQLVRDRLGAIAPDEFMVIFSKDGPERMPVESRDVTEDSHP